MYIIDSYRNPVVKNNIQKNINKTMTTDKFSSSIDLYNYKHNSKIHSYNTEILMYDGTIKLVQDIEVGDLLMGDDSTSRTVISTYKGKNIMYNIVYSNGSFFTVNKEHILSLKFVGKLSKLKRYKIRNKLYYIVYFFDFCKCEYIYNSFNNYKLAINYMNNIYNNHPKDKVIDISVKDYIALDNKIKKLLKCYKKNVKFRYKKTPLDPYEYALSLFSNNNNHINKFHYNPLIKTKNTHFDTPNFIHSDYLINNTENRLKLLNGIVNSSLYLSNHNHVKLHIYNIDIINDIIFLVRSLGYHIDFTYDLDSNKKRYIVNIYGSHINNLHSYIYNLSSCIYDNNSFDKHNITNLFNFEVEKYVKHNYYGFDLNKNKRYIMGDFTITHNTTSVKNKIL